MRRLVILIFFIVAFGCNDYTGIKPMRYTKNDKEYQCDAYYNSGQLQKVVCFSSNRDTLLIDNYKNNVVHGISRTFFNSGDVQSTGNYQKGQKNWCLERILSYRYIKILQILCLETRFSLISSIQNIIHQKEN